MIQKKNKRKAGVKNFPIQSMIRPGLSENQSIMAKKTREKMKRAVCLDQLPGSSWLIPVSKGTVKQRGMAKKGPMVRYRAQVKK